MAPAFFWSARALGNEVLAVRINANDWEAMRDFKQPISGLETVPKLLQHSIPGRIPIQLFYAARIHSAGKDVDADGLLTSRPSIERDEVDLLNRIIADGNASDGRARAMDKNVSAQLPL